MLRIVHVFDIKPGVIEESFVEWLDAQLDQITRRFGCEKRKTWMFLDGIRGNYERGNPDRRPKYLNEAFWPDQAHADHFRQWLLSPEGNEFRRRWFDNVVNHTVLRFVVGSGSRPVTDD